MNMIPEAIEIIVGKLVEENYLNETRFAQSFARPHSERRRATSFEL